MEEGSDVGLNVGALVLAQGIEVLGELLREFGERALDEEGSGRSGHDEDGGRKNEKKGQEREWKRLKGEVEVDAAVELSINFTVGESLGIRG